MPRVPQSYLDARRSEILSAARRSLASRGFGDTTMADIAREAGLSTGALYRYFESRADLLHALAEEGRESGRRLRREVADRAPDDPYARLLLLVRTYLGAMGPEADPVLRFSVQMWGEAIRHPELRREIAETYREMLVAFADVVRRCQEEGVLAPDSDPDEVGRAIVALLNEVGLQRALGLEVAVDAYADTVEELLDGLRRVPPA